MWRRKHQLTGRRTFSRRTRKFDLWMAHLQRWGFTCHCDCYSSLRPSFLCHSQEREKEEGMINPGRDSELCFYSDLLCDRSTEAMEKENWDHRRPYLMKEQHDRKDHHRTRVKNGILNGRNAMISKMTKDRHQLKESGTGYIKCNGRERSLVEAEIADCTCFVVVIKSDHFCSSSFSESVGEDWPFECCCWW